MLFRLGIAAAVAAIAAAAQDTALDRFEKEIRPVLAARCYACHSASAATLQGGLLLDSADGIRRGGNSGVVVQPGNPDQSLLIRAIRGTDKIAEDAAGESPSSGGRREIRGLGPGGRSAAGRSGARREKAARPVVPEEARHYRMRLPSTGSSGSATTSIASS